MQVWRYAFETRGPFIKDNPDDLTADSITLITDGTSNKKAVLYLDHYLHSSRVHCAKVVEYLAPVIRELQYMFEWLPGGATPNCYIDGPMFYNTTTGEQKTTRELYLCLRLLQTHERASTGD